MNEKEFYKDLYRDTDIGYDAVTLLLPKVEDGDLRHDMNLHMDGYRYFGKVAREHLAHMHTEATRDPAIKQLPAKIGMHMHTLFDRSCGHIAELMINGSNMSILNMRKKLNRLREGDGTGEAADVCQRMIDFEQDNIKRMQKYI